ncbi:hypothetical protein A9Q81_15685 [Gammaproteobacteria bacterium 42_54_T18]|nr:hypothetical protein A9Q81_15685 [Gammaproteobacteria bacterium 42_54_T18]
MLNDMPFDKETVRQAIPPLTIGEPVVEHESVRRYREYYGIDFENRKKHLSASLGYIDVSGYRIYTHTFLQDNPKGTVFVMHGYYDHVGIYDHIIEYLIDLRFSVVAFDLPGHGLSSGDNVAIHDFHRYQIVLHSVMDAAKENMPSPWHIVGQSTGAAVVIDFLLTGRFTQKTSPFKKIVLLAPLVRPQSWLTGRVMQSIVILFKQYIARNFATNSNDVNFLHFLRARDPLQSRMLSARWVGALKNWVPYIESKDSCEVPITVIQGQQDGTVEWQHNLAVIKKKFIRTELVFISQAHHQLVNETEALRKEIFGVMGSRLK